MRRVAYIFGWITMVIAGMLFFLGILSWPPGGLMFALPFFFIIPGVFLALIAAVLLWIGSRQTHRRLDSDGES
jgi:uncharacterized membrane protein YvlD (DUF360 family)